MSVDGWGIVLGLTAMALGLGMFAADLWRCERRSRALARMLEADVAPHDFDGAPPADPGPLPPETDLAAAMAQAEALHELEWGRLW